MSVCQKMVDHKMAAWKIMINHGFSEVQYLVFAWNVWNTTLAIFHVMQTTRAIRVNSGFYHQIGVAYLQETTTHSESTRTTAEENEWNRVKLFQRMHRKTGKVHHSKNIYCNHLHMTDFRLPNNPPVIKHEKISHSSNDIPIQTCI